MLSTKEYESFILFMESLILPMMLENPTHKRLDGKESGGNMKIIGKFRHLGLKWKVHKDTHYEPLLLAYYAFKYKNEAEVFKINNDNSIPKLIFADAINNFRDSHSAYLYIYQI